MTSATGGAGAPGGKGDTNEISTLTITFRAVSLSEASGQAAADSDIAFAVLQELQNNPLFEPDPQTHPDGSLTPDSATGTFTFRVIARLKKPLKL